ncbi:TPA: hypothetical protein PXM37_004298 [Yersinia enterocolitica]|nr:hypothetical protein [Yersinia enterocolitica]HDL6985337.1 hypothetical protein [Yersinia enterocolitica]HDL7067877.1 hypothetical protein [Yersinia enterocolitica]HDL7072268.1 hypothetical protein [Yersinia enterocolitica]
MAINDVSSVQLNSIQWVQNKELTVSSLDKVSPPPLVNNAAIELMMQQFMNDMYSSVEECPYSVNYKSEW